MKERPIICQISDTQFGDRFGFESYHVAAKALSADFDSLKDEDISIPNIIVHCGDIADSGDNLQFTNAEQFFETITKSNRINKNRLIIAPGNHDYNRNESDQIDNFKTFFNLFYRDCKNIRDEGNVYIYELIDDFNIVFFSIDSMDFINGKKSYEDFNRAINLNQKKYQNVLKICVIHHNIISSENEPGFKNFYHYLDALSSNNFQLLLHGHLHDNLFYPHINRATRKLINVIGTGSLSVNFDERPGLPSIGFVPNQYNIIDITNINVNEITGATLYSRQYIPNGQPKGKWTKYCIHPKNSDRIIFVNDNVDKNVNNNSNQFDKNTPALKIATPWIWSSDKQSYPTNYNGLKVLAISPHPDDIMQSCAATIMKLRQISNAKIWIYNVAPQRNGEMVNIDRIIEATISSHFLLSTLDKKDLLELISNGEKAKNNGFDAILKFSNKIINDYESEIINTPYLIIGAVNGPNILDGQISWDNLENYLFQLKQKIRPDIILTPFSEDANTDHAIVGEICDWIFRSQESVWHYELPKMEGKSHRAFEPNLYFNVSEKPNQNDFSSFADAKLFAFQNIFQKSEGNKHWFDMDLFKGNMRIRAAQAFYQKIDNQQPYAECFETKLIVNSIV